MISTRITRAARCALGLLLAACASPTREENVATTQLADEEDDAVVMWHSIPTTMNCGEERQVTVGMANYGTSTWEPGNYFLKAFQDPAPFEAPHEIGLSGPVGQGEPHDFSFSLRAPPFPVTANSRWSMYGPGWFGDQAGEEPHEVIRVTCPSAEDHAHVASANFPGDVECGQTFNANVTLANDGQTTWSPLQGYRLEAHPDNAFEGPSHVGVGNNVAPQQSRTFHMTLTAPPGPGSYRNEWQMTSDAGGPFDNAFSRWINVDCGEEPEDRAAISHNMPPSVQCGGHFTFQVRVTNTGTTNWAAQSYHLALTPDSVPLGELRYFLPHDIGPTQSHTFNITLHGPPHADTYYVAFQMFNASRNEPFGPRAEQHIEATCGNENAIVDDYDLATLVACGAPYRVEVTMKNTGLWSWHHEGQYALKNISDLPFSPWTPQIPIPPGTYVEPSHTHTFVAQLTANYTPGYYFNNWQMISWTGTPFGAPLISPVEVRCDEDMADLTNSTLPGTLHCGQAYQATVTYKNVGSGTWHPTYGHKLGAVGGTDPFAPTVIPIPGNPVILPGTSKTFTINMVGLYGPPGWYRTDWRMFRNDSPFGEIAESDVELTCSPLDSRFIGAASPSGTGCEPEVELSVSVRNTGFRAWNVSPGVFPDEFSFTQVGRLSPFALVESVVLPPEVKVLPGGTYSFPVRFQRAPYGTQRAGSWWRMRIERRGGGDRIDDAAGPQLFGQTMRILVPTMPRYCE